MRLEQAEIEAIADRLADLVAEKLETRLADLPEWAFSIAEAAACINVPDHVIRDAIRSGQLRAAKVGKSIRIRRSDLFRLHGGPDREGGDDAR
jgi:excisionase family DNA binding protein